MKAFFLSLFFLPVFLQAQQRFNISGAIKGLSEGSNVSLSDANNPSDTIAKGIVKDGWFVLQGSVGEPNLYQLNFDGAQKKSVVFIGNDSVSLTGDVENIQEITVSGSSTNEDFEAFKQIFNPLFQRLSAMGQQINATPGIKPNDSLMIAYKKSLSTVKTTVDNFVADHKSSPVAPFVMLVTSELEQDMPTMEKRFNQLDPVTKEGFYGRIIAQQIQEGRTGAIGTQAIEFTQADPEGKQVSLSSFKGKYVLVDFWASWCRPCRMENPNVVKVYHKFKDKNFTVLGVSLDRDREPWLKAIKDDHLVWTHVSDLKFWNNEAAAKYRIQSIPQNFLIDPTGKIVAKNLRGPDLESRLCDLLGCK